MYLGKVVEIAKSDTIYRDAKHPYTRALLSAVPIPDMNKKKERVVLEGDVPSPVNPPSGCRFHPRCPLRAELGDPAICADETPALLELGGGHLAACHFRKPTAMETPAV